MLGAPASSGHTLDSYGATERDKTPVPPLENQTHNGRMAVKFITCYYGNAWEAVFPFTHKFF